MKKQLMFIFLFAITNTIHAQQINITNGNNSWNEDSLGNHRAVIQFNDTGNVAKVIISWRRRDRDPQNKRIIIQDAKTQQKILNVKPANINRGFGELYFEPTSGKGIYYIYYMPYKNEGRSNYPKGIYLKPEQTASANWLNKINEMAPSATVIEIQSINEFNSFYPMEVIATQTETDNLLKANIGKAFIIFPEDRIHPIKMTTDLPQRWIEKGVQKTFTDTTLKGENFSFQLGIYALTKMQNVKIKFSDLKSSNGDIISAKNISCLNTDGISYDDKPLHFTVNIDEKKVQAMWCLIDIPENISSGLYQGKAIVTDGENNTTEVELNIFVDDKIIADGGVNEPWKQTRLKWLNSTLAQKNTVIKPYIPLKVDGKNISLLGRKIILNDDGLPKQIQTFFTEEMTSYTNKPKDILQQPFQFFAYDNANTKLAWKNSGVTFTSITPGTVKWKSISASDALKMEVNASAEFDGFVSYSIKITALKDAKFSNTGLIIPYNSASAKYIMGLNLIGESLPEKYEWKWDVVHKNQDGAWIGDVNSGMQFSLRDERYVRPLNTNFYLQKPLLLPTSWGNENKGGIKINTEKSIVFVNNYSGEREMKKADTLYYNFNLLITPFHTINTDFQWANRFYHAYNNVDSIKATGATIINIHHATPINPYINYPFIAWKKMKAYIDSAHAIGLKVKIYNTVRELSDHAYETFALKSLGHEIYSPGKGGGFSWLQEHFDSDYIAAWFVPELKDAAIVNSGMNRWHNYYVEGMNWLTKNVGIDGIYLDDVAFDRITMKRIKRVLTEDGHPGIIDLHSANQYDSSDGFNNSANLYMEHFPYLNRLWFGEYFDYKNNSPDFFLTEVSGIPFGLMGEMLQGGGNAWRGMIYGMTNRMPWSDNANPRPIWKVWDEFGMQGTEMIGYWSSNCPVKTTNEKVLATVYKKNNKALISIASWADDDVTVQLKIDWKKLGIDSSKAAITAPEIKNFQSGKTFKLNEKILVEKGKGWLLIIK
ncbi:MAG: glycoside hydrolase domain-containing protein [Chitinophagaceae bacterium]